MSWPRWLRRRANPPAHATFRRAEGLTLRTSLCQPDAPLDVECDRHGGPTRTLLPRAALSTLCRAQRWAPAAAMGLSAAEAARWVDDNLLFFSHGHPQRNLWDGPRPLPKDRVVLRPHAWPKLLVSRDGTVDTFPFMVRRGMLDGAALHGMQFSTFEHGRRTLRLKVACCALHGEQWRDLLPRLTGAETLEALEQHAPEAIRLLRDADLLEPAVPPAPWDGVTPRVTWLAHATVLYEAAGKRLLVDPLFHPISHPDRDGEPRPPDPRQLGPVDAVLITHGDNDHLNAQALQWLPADTPVFIPRAPERHPYQVDMEGLLRVLGFSRVQEMSPWESARVGPVTVRAAPFRGEDWGLTLAAATWVVDHPDLTIHCNADSTLMEDVCTRIAAEHRVDVAFLGVTGCAESHLGPPGFGYGNFYAMWIPAERRNQWVQLCAGPEDAARSAVLLNARHAVGYAAGGAPYVAMAFSDTGSHAQMVHHLQRMGQGHRAWALRVGEPSTPAAPHPVGTAPLASVPSRP